MKPSKIALLVLATGLVGVGVTATQEPPQAVDSLTTQASPRSQPLAGLTETVVYEREVFSYPAGARPDPFRSLLLDGDLGIRVEDLMLRGIVYHSDPSRSVAIMTQTGTDRRMQARVGESVGPLRILGIYPDRVEIVIEELGVARRETLRLARPQTGADQ